MMATLKRIIAAISIVYSLFLLFHVDESTSLLFVLCAFVARLIVSVCLYYRWISICLLFSIRIENLKFQDFLAYVSLGIVVPGGAALDYLKYQSIHMKSLKRKFTLILLDRICGFIALICVATILHLVSINLAYVSITISVLSTLFFTFLMLRVHLVTFLCINILIVASNLLFVIFLIELLGYFYSQQEIQLTALFYFVSNLMPFVPNGMGVYELLASYIPERRFESRELELVFIVRNFSTIGLALCGIFFFTENKKVF